MKKIIVAFLILISISCKKDEEKVSGSFIGSWEVIDSYENLSDGNIYTFSSDGTGTGEPYFRINAEIDYCDTEFGWWESGSCLFVGFNLDEDSSKIFSFKYQFISEKEIELNREKNYLLLNKIF